MLGLWNFTLSRDKSLTLTATHSLTRPISQPIKQISQPNDGSINQSIVQSTNHSVHQLFKQSTTDSSTLSECVRRLLETCYCIFILVRKKDPPPPAEQNGDDSYNKSIPISDMCNTLENKSVGVYGISPMTNHSLSHPATHSLHTWGC